MKKLVCFQYRTGGRRHRGFILLGTLIAIAIGMLIYYFAFYRINSGLLDKQKKSPDAYPWVQEDRIVDLDTGAEPKKPNADQPNFTEAMLFNARVREEGKQRGKLEILYHPSGQVEVAWSGEFLRETEKGDKEYLIMGAEAQGNIDPTKIFKDEQGEDPCRLYFITKGSFTMMETIKRNNRVRHASGALYVTGWFLPDLSAQGTLHLTSDKKSQTVFTWKAIKGKPPEF